MDPLTFAVLRNNKQLVVLLLRNGADPYQNLPWLLAKKLGHEDIAALLPPIFDDAFIIKFLKYLNYSFSRPGICLGFSHMAKHAIITRETERFNKRLFLIMDLFFYGNSMALKKMGSGSGRLIGNRNKEYEQLCKSFILQAINDLKTSKNQQQKYVNIRALCDGLVLYHLHPNHLSLYPKKSSPPSAAAAQQTLQIVMPTKTLIEYRGELTSVYPLDDLTLFFSVIQEMINALHFTRPLAIILLSIDHAMTVGYDGLKQSWVYANSQIMPLTWISNRERLSKIVNQTFSRNEYTILKSVFYAAHEDRDKMDALMRKLLKDPRWQKIHEVTLSKIAIRSGKKHIYSWKDLASGMTLQKIQNIKRANQYRLFRYPQKCYDTLFQSVRDRTNEYEQEVDDDKRPITVYQRLAL